MLRWLLYRPDEVDMEYLHDIANRPLIAAFRIRFFVAAAWFAALVRFVMAETARMTIADWFTKEKSLLSLCVGVQVVEVGYNIWAALAMRKRRWGVEYWEAMQLFGHGLGILGHTICSIIIKDTVPMTGPRGLVIYAVLALVEQLRVQVVLKKFHLFMLMSFAFQMLELCASRDYVATLSLLLESALFWGVSLMVPAYLAYYMETHRRRQLNQTVPEMSETTLQMGLMSSSIVMLHIIAACDVVIVVHGMVGGMMEAAQQSTSKAV